MNGLKIGSSSVTRQGPASGVASAAPSGFERLKAEDVNRRRVSGHPSVSTGFFDQQRPGLVGVENVVRELSSACERACSISLNRCRFSRPGRFPTARNSAACGRRSALPAVESVPLGTVLEGFEGLVGGLALSNPQAELHDFGLDRFEGFAEGIGVHDPEQMCDWPQTRSNIRFSESNTSTAPVQVGWILASMSAQLLLAKSEHVSHRGTICWASIRSKLGVPDSVSSGF